MPAVLFDTLKMAETLQAGGFTDQQARTMTTALGDAATVAAVATRGDVMDLGIGMKHDIDAFQAKFDSFQAKITHDFTAFQAKIEHDLTAFQAKIENDFSAFKVEMRGIEQRIVIRMGAMMVVMTGVLGGLHFLH